MQAVRMDLIRSLFVMTNKASDRTIAHGTTQKDTQSVFTTRNNIAHACLNIFPAALLVLLRLRRSGECGQRLLKLLGKGIVFKRG